MSRRRTEGTILPAHTDTRRMRAIPLTPAGILSTQIAQAPRGEAPYVLFLGAGASVSSGIPSTATLISDWQRQLYSILKETPRPSSPDFPTSAFKAWLRSQYPAWLNEKRREIGSESEYSTLFELICKTRQQRQIYIESLVDHTRPGLGYIYLAGLIASGYINTVLTTNFDDLLLDALVRYYDTKPIVCAFDSAVTSFSSSSQRPKIIKLHGDFLFDDIRATDADTLDLSENMEAKLVEVCEDKGLIVVGYSGNDESVLAPIRENLRRSRRFCAKGLHWCVYLPEASNTTALPVGTSERAIASLRQRYPERVHAYATRGFDTMMLDIFESCGIALPSGVLNPYSTSLAHAFNDACSAFEVRQRLSPAMLRHRRSAIDSLDNNPDRRALDIHRANEAFEEGFALVGTDDELARTHFLEGLKIIDGVLTETGPEDSNYWVAIRRSTGLQISLGKLAEGAAQRELYIQAAQPVLEYLRKESTTSATLPGDLLLAIYNCACACGLLHEIETAPAAKSLHANAARTLITAMCRTTTGRSHLAKLIRDPDIRSLIAAGEIEDYLGDADI